MICGALGFSWTNDEVDPGPADAIRLLRLVLEPRGAIITAIFLQSSGRKLNEMGPDLGYEYQ